MKTQSNSTLQRLTKAELIDELRITEMNMESIEALYHQQIENVKDWEPVRHGHWEWDDELGANTCSECGRPTYDSHDECVDFMGSKVIALVSPYYCGFCGAKMDGGEDG